MNTMKKIHFYLLLVILFCVSTGRTFAADYYWVGGGGNWSDVSHWATESGGSVKHNLLPTIADDVYFDDKSGFIATTAGRLVTVNVAGKCKDIKFEGCPVAPTLILSQSLEINGSMLLQSGMGWNFATEDLIFTSSGTETIKTNGVLVYSSMQFTGSGTYTIQDDLTFNMTHNNRNITVSNGKLIMNNITVTGRDITCSGVAEIEIKNSILNLFYWDYTSSTPLTSDHTENSKIVLTGSLLTYSTNTFTTTNATDIYNDLTLTGDYSYTITGGTFNKITFVDTYGTIASTGMVTTNNLILQSSGKYTFANPVTVNNLLSAKPLNCGGFMELTSSNTTVRDITMGDDAVVVAERMRSSYINIFGDDMPASGYPVINGIDGGNTSGWDFQAGTGSTYYWVDGAGDWNDPLHWADESGGTGGTGCIPTPFDNVVFDDASGFTATTDKVNLDMPAYCDSLSFIATTTPAFNFAITNPIEIYGSLYCQKGMYFESSLQYGIAGQMRMMSDRPNETITLNGTMLRGPLVFNSPKETGGWSLQDSLIVHARLSVLPSAAENNSSIIYFQSGHLNFNGQYVRAYGFNSLGNASPYKISRSLNIANSTIELLLYSNGGWSYTGGQTLTSAQTQNSLIRIDSNSGGLTAKSGDAYYDVETIGRKNGNVITQGTYNKISLGSRQAALSTGVQTDSLVFITSGTYYLRNNVPIHKYLATDKACGGGVKLYSNTAGTQRTITMGNDSEVELSDMFIRDIKITGPGIDYPITASIDEGNNEGWEFLVTGTGNTYYWVGDEGDWSVATNWSTTSGVKDDGSGCVPSIFDNVIFDDNSFSDPGQIVTIDEAAYCHDMDWIGNSSLAPKFIIENLLAINGSLKLQEDMIISGGGSILFDSSDMGETITNNGVQFPVTLTFDGTGGWKLMDSFYQSGPTKAITFTNGNLDFNGQYAQVNGFISTGGNAIRSLNIANSTIDVSGFYTAPWIYTGGVPLTAEQTANSVIRVYGAIHNNLNVQTKVGDIYNNLEIYYSGGTIDNATFNKIYLAANATLNSITTDTLQFKAGGTYSFTAGATSYINEAWYGSGNNCYPTYIVSSTPGTRANVEVKKEAANVYDEDSNLTNELLLDFIYLRDINAVTGDDLAVLKKGPMSPDAGGYGINGNNNNWIMEAYIGSEGFQALGPDIAIMCGNFPYTIHTTGMAATPQSIFAWRKGSPTGPVISNADMMVLESAADAGTYYCSVNYGDNCVLQGSVTISSPDAAFLIWNGNAGDQDWHNPLNWEVEEGGNSENLVPARCISVLIPAGISNYPDLSLTTIDAVNTEIACDVITFEHGGEVRRTDLLDYYTYANVQLTLNSNQWYMLSAPLHNMYTGDFYVTDPAPLEDGYFMEPMKFNSENPQLGTDHEYSWTGRYNTADVEYQPGEGFALWIDKHGTEYTDLIPTTMHFPKEDTFYNYYNYGGGIIGQTPTLDRSKNGRFIHEGVIDTDGDMILKDFSSGSTDESGKEILIGNPFMTHLDFASFAERNKDEIDNGFKLAWNVSTENGKMKDFVSYIYDSGSGGYVSNGDQLDLIAPMQSFIVVSKKDKPTIVVNSEEDTQTDPGNVLRSASLKEENSILHITANRGDKHFCKALVLYRDYASNQYAGSEDSYKLFSSSSLSPVLVYTRSSDGYALDINSFGDTKETVPVGIRTSKQGEITLNFSGMDSFDDTDIYFIDTHTGYKINLSETASYRFTKDDTHLYLDDRFYLSFVSRSGTGIHAPSAGFTVSNRGKDIHILNPSGDVLQAYIYSVSGNCLFREEVSGYKPVIHIPLTQGIYIVKLISEQESTTKTIIIK